MLSVYPDGFQQRWSALVAGMAAVTVLLEIQDASTDQGEWDLPEMQLQVYLVLIRCCLKADQIGLKHFA